MRKEMDDFKSRTYDKFIGKLKRSLAKFDRHMNQRVQTEIKQYIEQLTAQYAQKLKIEVQSQVGCNSGETSHS